MRVGTVLVAFVAACALVLVPGAGGRIASPRPVVTSAQVDSQGHLVVTWTKAASDKSGFVVWSQYPETEPGGDGFPCGPGAEPFLYRAHRDPLGGFPAVPASATSYRSPNPLVGTGKRYVQVIVQPTVEHEDPERPGRFTTICGHYADPVEFTIPSRTGGGGGTKPKPKPDPGGQQATAAQRTANTAELPLDNGTAECRNARARITALNGQLAQVVSTWNFRARQKPSSDATVQRGREGAMRQLEVRIKELEAQLRRAVADGARACGNGAESRPAGGNATVLRGDGRRQPLGKGLALVPGDTIRTAARSSAVVALPDGSEVIIGPGASLVLGDRAKDKRFLQQLGEAWYRIKKAAAGFEVVGCQPACVAAVRGTSFTFARVGGRARLRVYDGSVELTSSGRAVVVREGFEATAGAGGPTAPVSFVAPANPFWVTVVGTWRNSKGNVVRFDRIAGGFEQRVMRDLRIDGCLYPAGRPYARFLSRGNELYRVAYFYRVPGKGGAGKDGRNCTGRWHAPEETARLVVTSDTIVRYDQSQPTKVLLRYTRLGG